MVLKLLQESDWKLMQECWAFRGPTGSKAGNNTRNLAQLDLPKAPIPTILRYDRNRRKDHGEHQPNTSSKGDLYPLPE